MDFGRENGVFSLVLIGKIKISVINCENQKEIKLKNMEKTNIYIDRITFNDGSSFSFNNSDIVVFTGPNNCGKSQVLRDIKDYFTNKNIQRIIATDITPQFLGDVEYLKSKCINKNGKYYLDNIVVNIDNLKYQWGQKKYKQYFYIFY